MAQVINLNRFRKESARAAKRTKANASSAKHGRTKAQETLDVARRLKTERALDDLNLDHDP